ncbi:type VI secretion system lipoprotein TssJ [Yersinia intermedia]|uniref:Type VI secretion system-associated lipoprotein n=1 Tax=Yersinia intermedia TaxID=631 RepID=A0A208ZML8_YERIN|nr:type VI secretion system-associated lipoprotein [Yersinia intermedia]
MSVTRFESGHLLRHKNDVIVAVTKSIFYKQVKIPHLDIQAREAVNNDATVASLATLGRIYQLKDRKMFDGTDYPSLFAEDSQVIKADLVAEKDIRISLGAAVSIDVPPDEKAEYVAVTGLFLAPYIANNTCRVVLSCDDLDPDKTRKIELNNHGMTLLPLKDK